MHSLWTFNSWLFPCVPPGGSPHLQACDTHTLSQRPYGSKEHSFVSPAHHFTVHKIRPESPRSPGGEWTGAPSALLLSWFLSLTWAKHRETGHRVSISPPATTGPPCTRRSSPYRPLLRTASPDSRTPSSGSGPTPCNSDSRTSRSRTPSRKTRSTTRTGRYRPAASPSEPRASSAG
jgi:hypothetical protein